MEPPDAASNLSPSFAARVGPGNIRTLILEKEKELHDINEYRIRTLEALLRDKETMATAAKQKLSKLQEDFKYNLKLLEGRDEELTLYDANFAMLKNVLRDREMELSESKAREAEVQAEVKQWKQRASDADIHYQQKLKDARAQLNGAKWQFDDELRRQEEAMEKLRQKLAQQMREKEDEVDTERRELTVTFDAMMRQRELAFQETREERESQLRELEVKNQALVRELDHQRSRAEELTIKRDTLQQRLQENEKDFKAFEWTVADEKAAKEMKIKELETEVATLNEVKQKLLDEYESKMAELVQSLHAVEKAFVHQKMQSDEEVQRLMDRTKREADEASGKKDAKVESLRARLQESEERVEALQDEVKQSKWDAEDQLMMKEQEVDRLKSALQEVDEEHHRVINEMHKKLRAGERESQIAHEKLHDLQRQLTLLKEKDKAQRHELLESVEKQDELQQKLVSIHSRWELRWQQEQREINEQHEVQINELKQANERLMRQKERLEEQVAHAEKRVQQLCLELDTLKSSARLSESFSPHFVASTARQGEEARQSSNSVPVAPSPLWSGDPGTLSPVTGMSPLLTDSPQLKGKTMKSTSASALELENEKLREIIRQMKESLTNEANGMDVSPRSTSAQLLEIQERCVSFETKLHESTTEVHSLTLQLESCKRELSEAQRMIEAKNTQVAEFRSRLQKLEDVQVETESAFQSQRATLEAQVTELKQEVNAATCDLDRLVRERSQLMELSNQLRADLRKSGTETGSKALTPPVEFAEKHEYEAMIADLTQSLEEARIHNKTLKKELRRLVKAHVQLQEDRESLDNEAKQSGNVSMDPEKRRSSTLSMMKALNPPIHSKARSGTSSIRSLRDRKEETTASQKDLDQELLSLARKKQPDSELPTTLARDRVSTLANHGPDSDVDINVSVDDDDDRKLKGEKVEISRISATRSAPHPPLETEGRAASMTSTPIINETSRAKVTDARLKLQQAKEMLLLSGKQAPIAGSRALTTLSAQTAPATRLSDRATSSQRSAVQKLKQLQSKRAEMVHERKKVRNYSLA